jgi:hypothetical protein
MRRRAAAWPLLKLLALITSRDHRTLKQTLCKEKAHERPQANTRGTLWLAGGGGRVQGNGKLESHRLGRIVTGPLGGYQGPQAGQGVQDVPRGEAQHVIRNQVGGGGAKRQAAALMARCDKQACIET